MSGRATAADVGSGGDLRRTRRQLSVVVALGVVRVAATFGSTPVVMPDSERYRRDSAPWVPFEVWDGHGPGVLTQVVHLLPLQVAVVVQTVAVVALWGGAALYAGYVAAPRWSWPVFTVLSSWALSPWFLLWDPWVLTEALTLGGCTVAAVGMGAARRGATHAHVVAIAGSAVAITARPFVAALLLPLLALTYLWPGSPGPSRRRRATALATLAVVLLGAFGTWQVLAFSAPSAMPFSNLPEPESLRQVQATDRLAGRGDVPGYLVLARQHGMPPCPAAETAATGPATVGEKLVALRLIDSCPDLEPWLADGGLAWTRELTDNTSATLAELTTGSSWLDESFATYVTPDDRLLALRETTGARWSTVVVAVNAVMFAAVAVAAVLGLLLAPRGQRSWWSLCLAVVAGFLLASWGTDGLEYWRHLLPGLTVVLPMALSLLAAAPPARDTLPLPESPARVGRE